MRNTILQELHAEYEQRQQQNQQEETRRRMQAESACPVGARSISKRSSDV